MKLLLSLLLLLSTLFAAQQTLPSDEKLKKMIGKMLIVGFNEEAIHKNSDIVQLIQKYELSGVILFDRFYDERNKTRNIGSPEQLQKLTKNLQSFSKKPLIICVDQEGGKVARLKPEYGFLSIASAQKTSTLGVQYAKESYEKMADMLIKNGINCNFAPVVDLAINPKNSVIVQKERSFGSSPQEVSKYAKILIDAQNKHGVISALKHFPGHGSSLGDSHKGFVDITKTWSKKELEPFETLIKSGDVSMIMTAHVFNANLDSKYPATLSYNVNTKLLREKMQYKGVVVSDDMQMKAISQHYSLQESVTLAINSGVDILLFGNQLANQYVDDFVNVILAQVKSGAISYARILESNQRIEQLQNKL